MVFHAVWKSQGAASMSSQITPLSPGAVMLPARPEPIPVDPKTTAVIVIDISGAEKVIHEIKGVLTTARAAGMQVIYFQNGWDDQYVEAGGPGSPNWWKSNALKTMRARPELQGKLLARGQWDYELVDELKPEPGDIQLHKTRYSGFFNSQLDSVLRARGIRHLVFVGIATNVCVESTLRDGFFLEYFGTVLEDATHQAGPEFVQKAALFNIETFFGWVSTTADFKGTFGQLAPTP
jgi:ureidoacrylate peracid hydrolase